MRKGQVKEVMNYLDKKKTIAEIVKLLLDDNYWDIKDGGDTE
jgi:hypothetical protein